MKTRFVEAVSVGPDGETFNFGKFAVCRFDEEEWQRKSTVTSDPSDPGSLDSRPALVQRGWSRTDLLVVDLQTGEGAIFSPGGLPGADLTKHRIWVCPLYEPFLKWLYKQDLKDLASLPSVVRIPWSDAPPSLTGYRRPGRSETPEEASRDPDFYGGRVPTR